MVIKLSMYVGLHDVYPTMNVIFACNFMSGGEKMREVLNKKRGKKEKKRRKEKGKVADHLIGQKRCEIFTLCRSVSRRS